MIALVNLGEEAISTEAEMKPQTRPHIVLLPQTKTYLYDFLINDFRFSWNNFCFSGFTLKKLN